MSLIVPITDPITRWIAGFFPKVSREELEELQPDIEIVDPVAFGLQRLGEGLAGVLGGLGSAISSTIITATQNFWGLIEGGLDLLIDAISGTVAGLVSVIQNTLSNLANTFATGLMDLLSFLGTALTDLGTTLLDGLAVAFEVLSDVFQTVWKWLDDNVIKPLIDAAISFFGWMTQGAQDSLQTVWDAIVDVAPRSPEGGVAGALAVGGITAAIAIGTSVGAASVDATHPFKQLGAIMIAQNAISIIGIDGLAREAFSALFEVAIIIPMRHELNAEFTREIPGPGDLVRFVVREAIDPPEFDRQMRFHGFSGKWSDAFWAAHWELVARGELTDMLHRGIIDMDTYVKQLVLHDFRPEHTDWLVANTFRLPSRAEITSLLEVSDPTDEQIRMWLTADGISAELLPVYEDLVKSRRLLRVKTRVETLVRRGLKEGFFSESFFVDTLRRWRFTEKIIAAELDLAKLDFDLDTSQDLKSLWVDSFRKGEIDASGLATELLAIGMVDDRVGIIVAREEIRALPKPKK